MSRQEPPLYGTNPQVFPLGIRRLRFKDIPGRLLVSGVGLLSCVRLTPFPEERKKPIGALSVRQMIIIRELSGKKVSVQEIAAKAGCSVMGVYRHREDHAEGDGTSPADQLAVEQ